MPVMSVVDICSYLFPNQFECGNIKFGMNPNELPFITKWTVTNVEQPSIEYLVSQIPNFQKQFDLDYFKKIGSILLMDLLDEVAGQRLYSSALSCISYLNSTIDAYKLEAQALNVWRDSVFNYTIEQILLMQSEERNIPSFEDFKLELPAIIWP